MRVAMPHRIRLTGPPAIFYSRQIGSVVIAPQVTRIFGVALALVTCEAFFTLSNIVISYPGSRSYPHGTKDRPGAPGCCNNVPIPHGYIVSDGLDPARDGFS